MELMERYLAAVRRDLPPAKADDIIAELRDDLLTRIEAREDALGRPLEKVELEQVLRDSGRPLVVAARYREHQYLIGPATFPYYLAGLRFGALIVCILTAVLVGVDMAFGSRNLWQAAAQALGNLFGFAIWGFGMVTLLFAAVERRGTRVEDTEWVEELPSLEELTRKGRADAPIEIVTGTLFLLWWFGFIPLPTGWEQFTLAGAPVWAGLFWPIGILVSARLVLSLLALAPDRVDTLRRLLDIATGIGGVAIVVVLYQAGHWIEVIPGTMEAAQAVKLEESLNLAARIALIVSAITWTLAIAGSIWKWLRGR